MIRNYLGSPGGTTARGPGGSWRPSVRLGRCGRRGAAAVAAFAAASPGESDALRARLFAALWFEGRDIGEPAVIAELGGDAAAAGGERRVSRWREEWLGHDRQLVPMLVLPDGHVSRGLGALARLAELITLTGLP